MKVKSVAATRVVAVSFLLAFFICLPQAHAMTALYDQTLSFINLSSQLKTPEQIAEFMWRHFEFEKDQRQFGTSDYWQNAHEMVVSGKGDCEDFAMFAKELLRIQGIPAFLLSIYGSQYAHTVCIFQDNGFYRAIDGSEILPEKAQTLQELMDKIHPGWNRGAIVTKMPQQSSGRILKKIQR